MKKWRKGIVVAYLATLPALASAQTETLQYFGSPFTSFTTDENAANGLATVPAENTGEIVLGAALGDNLSNVLVTPLSWTFDISVFSGFYTTSQLPDNSGSFIVSTDDNGNLIAWNISVGGNDFGSTNSPSYANVGITNDGDSFSAGVAGYVCATYPGGLTPCFDVSASNSAPGKWTISPNIAAAPEFDPTSAYAAVTLLLGGLAVLRSRRSLSR